MKAEKSIELTKEDKKQLTDLLKRMSDFGTDLEQEQKSDEDDDERLHKLASLNLDDMSIKEAEEILGEELLTKFNEFCDSAEAHSIQSQKFSPWWNEDKSEKVIDLDEKSGQKLAPPVIDGNLPAFKSISKTPPSEFLWCNIMDLLLSYIYLYKVYLGDIDSLREEFVQVSLQISDILSARVSKHESVPAAINSIVNNILRHGVVSNPPEFIAAALDDLKCLIKDSENVVRCLCDMKRIFELEPPTKNSFMASKKLYYYCVWLNSELQDNRELTDDIFSSMELIIKGIIDRILMK